MFEASARPATAHRTVRGKRVAFSADSEGGDARAILVGQVYSLCGFPGQGFDEYWIRRIREDIDPGLVPIMRRMVFREVTGGEIWMENWGVARYSRKQPAAEWELKLLNAATRPTSGYLSTLERPNLIDVWLPMRGMDDHGLPPGYEPFKGPLLYQWFAQILRARQACRDISAFELLMEMVYREEQREQRDIEHEIDQRARGAVDLFPKFSTTNVRPTPRHLQIQETPA